MARTASTEGMTQVQLAEVALKGCLSTFLKLPKPSNYDALVAAGLDYQAAFAAQFAPAAPAAPAPTTPADTGKSK